MGSNTESQYGERFFDLDRSIGLQIEKENQQRQYAHAVMSGEKQTFEEWYAAGKYDPRLWYSMAWVHENFREWFVTVGTRRINEPGRVGYEYMWMNNNTTLCIFFEGEWGEALKTDWVFESPHPKERYE